MDVTGHNVHPDDHFIQDSLRQSDTRRGATQRNPIIEHHGGLKLQSSNAGYGLFYPPKEVFLWEPLGGGEKKGEEERDRRDLMSKFSQKAVYREVDPRQPDMSFRAVEAIGIAADRPLCPEFKGMIAIKAGITKFHGVKDPDPTFNFLMYEDKVHIKGEKMSKAQVESHLALCEDLVKQALKEKWELENPLRTGVFKSDEDSIKGKQEVAQAWDELLIDNFDLCHSSSQVEKWADHIARQELALAKASTAMKGWAAVHGICLHKHSVTMAKLGTAMDKAKYEPCGAGAIAGDIPQVMAEMDAMAVDVKMAKEATEAMDPLHQQLQIYQKDRPGGKHLLALTELLHSTKRLRGPIGLEMPHLHVVQNPAGSGAGNTAFPGPPPEPAQPAGQEIQPKQKQAETAAAASGGQNEAPNEGPS